MSDEGEGLEIGAVLKGAVVGGIVSLIESTVVGMMFMKGTPHSQAEATAAAQALMASNTYLFTDLAASLLCMAFGGWIAAGSAGHSGTKHGAVTGVLLLAFVGVMALVSPQGVPGWYIVAVFLLIIPAAALGGKLRD